MIVSAGPAAWSHRQGGEHGVSASAQERLEQVQNYRRPSLKDRRVHPDGDPGHRSVPYSMTLSARSRTLRGIVSWSALAVRRFTTVSNFSGCCIGMSAGFAPLKIRSTKPAA